MDCKKCINCRFGCDDGPCGKGLKPYICDGIYWQPMTAAQVFEDVTNKSSSLSNKKLIGDLTNGYRYVDTDTAEAISKAKERAEMVKLDVSKLYPKELLDYIENDVKATTELMKGFERSNNMNVPVLKDVERFCKETNIRWFIERNDIYTLKLTFSKDNRVIKRFIRSGRTLNQYELIKDLKHQFDIQEVRYMDYNAMYRNRTKYWKSPEIKDVIFSGPCTIVLWKDGDKTVVRCENENFDKEKGLAMAICKKLFGTNETKSNYYDIFKKWIPEEKPIKTKIKITLLQKEKPAESKQEDSTPEVSGFKKLYSVITLAKKEGVKESTIRSRIRRGKYPDAYKVDGVWWIPLKED